MQNDSIRNQIIKKLCNLNQKYFHIYNNQNSFRPLQTVEIKYCLTVLGHKLTFKVYTNGLIGKGKRLRKSFINKEWLYDLHWYKDAPGKHYSPERLCLVAESELGNIRPGDKKKIKNGAIMFDFQKLLISNSELRLLVFKTQSLQELKDINIYFNNAIETYKHLRKNDKFIFICFVHKEEQVYYSVKQK